MAKTLSFTDTSPQTVKIGDTTTSFTLICGNDNVATDLTKATSITVKLGNASGYLKSATVSPTSLTDPTTGQVTVNFNADLMTSLTAGSYAIEVWVVDSTGTSIYPSDGSTGFTITNNIQSANGSVITTITFDDFVKAMNKAASTIAKGDKGDKGDTGTVDNAGLISAPAFHSLQTQVQNSAVGTNLLMATRSMDFSATPTEKKWSYDTNHVTVNANGMVHVDTSNMTSGSTDIDQLVRVQPSTDYTYTIQLRNGTTSSTYGQFVTLYAVEFKDAGGSPTQNYNDHSFIIGNTDQRKYTNVTFKTQPDCQYIVVYIRVYYGYIVDFETPKLELGTNSTDWCPNPSEVLTQSDYAKIKAAIVALGGALS